MEKPEYMIMHYGEGFAIYRKLFSGEYFWYRNELYRLKKYKNELWLRLDTDDSFEKLEATVNEMKKGLV